eukprot:scaffold27961_cov51-Attheya_sp.AAC.2
MKSRVSLVVIFAVFIGVIVGLVIASNFDLTDRTIAADAETATPILLGAQDDMLDQSQVSSAQSLSNAFAHVAQVVKGSVVTIKSTQMVRTEVLEFWQHFFNVPEEQRRQGLGSGVIVNPDGYIITNNHVVENADELQVSIDNMTYDAEIVGRADVFSAIGKNDEHTFCFIFRLLGIFFEQKKGRMNSTPILEYWNNDLLISSLSTISTTISTTVSITTVTTSAITTVTITITVPAVIITAFFTWRLR